MFKNSIAIMICFVLASFALSYAAESGGAVEIKIPPILAEEHQKLRAELDEAINSGGNTGVAAREVKAKLDPHFQNEEKYALPPLGLLEPIRQGKVSPGMKPAIEMANQLNANYETMLQEHKDITASLKVLSAAAKEKKKMMPPNSPRNSYAMP